MIISPLSSICAMTGDVSLISCTVRMAFFSITSFVNLTLDDLRSPSVSTPCIEG